MAEISTSTKFNTFSGVFIPSVLGIVGAVIFLIAPKVLGGVGLIKMIAIILIAHSITFATAFSISAIATNIHVRGGGLYYLISRSLGREFGGSMGIQLFLAQIMSIAFYNIAFATGLTYILNTTGLLNYIGISLSSAYIGLLSLFFFFMIAFKGAKFVIKLQYLIFVVLIMSVLSLLFAQNNGNYIDHLTGEGGIFIPFWVAFAMYFPAVSGMDAGIGMSGDLKNPRKSLVIGTFAAISFTMIVYILTAIKLSFVTDPMSLSINPYIAQEISLFPILILIGILVASSSSVLSYFMTTPRTLRALVEDKIFSDKFSFFSKSFNKSNEPHVGLIICFLISALIVYFGNLFLVSQIVTIFFLNVYGWINGAAFFEKISKNPSYRPSFNSPWYISLYGMVACYLIMYLFNPYIMFIGIIFQIFIFFILAKNSSSIRLESVWDGVLFQFLRGILTRIEKSEQSKKNWRPTIVSFSINEKNHTTMISLLDWISSNRSIMKMYVLIKGKINNNVFIRNELESKIKNYIKEYEYELFPRVIVTENFENTFETIIQSETLGNRPLNTVLVDFDSKIKLHSIANISFQQKKNFIILRNQGGYKDFRKIDVWWSNTSNGNLGIYLAYLITHSKKWKIKEPIIRVFKIVQNKDHIIEESERINKMIKQSRIENIEVIILNEPENKINDIINSTSYFSDLVIIGLSKNKKGIVDKNSIEKVKNLTNKLNTCLIVRAYDQIDFKIN
jgi:amino acid transporter